MEVGPGEQLADLIKQLVEEAVYLFISGAEYPGVQARSEPNFMGLAGAAQLRHGGDNGSGMAGQVYFGDNIDEALRRIFYYLPYLLLGIISPGLFAVLIAPGADTVEVGELQALNAEALVVAEMPVEGVHLQPGHVVQELFDFIHAEEMPAHIQHEAAEGEFRRIFVAAVGYVPLPGELFEGLSCVECPGAVPGFYPNFLRSHSQNISLPGDAAAALYCDGDAVFIAADSAGERDFSIDFWDKVHPEPSFQGKSIDFSIA